MDWQKIAIHDDKNIKGFFGPYRFLSNFHLCPVQFEGIVYPANENAYMAAKCKVHAQRVVFKDIAPKEAKSEGRKVLLREDWEEVKLNIMYELNKQKFEWHPELRAALLATGDRYIEETNWWKDIYWGCCDGVGQNHLGRIIMRIRDELKQA